MDDRKLDAAPHGIFTPDGHLTADAVDALADQQLADETRAAEWRRVAPYAVAIWWLRAWWRVTKGGRG